MKLCPFLVAGQSMLPVEERAGTIPITPVEKGPEGETDPRQCLGEPCRFFHAGGCRFDALFEAQDRAQSPTTGGLPDAPVNAGAILASIPSVLEEVWSLQRESLREVMSGFRKLENERSAALHEVQERIGELRSLLERMESGAGAGAGDAKAVGPEILDLVGRHFETLVRDVRQIDASIRSSLGDSVRTFVKESQTAAFTSAEASLRAVLEGVQTAVRASAQDSQASVRESFEKLQSQLGSVLGSAAEGKQERVEETLGALTTELQQARDARIQAQASLEGLMREAREMTSLARRVESSQVLTNELLDEQRQVHEVVETREKRDRARQLNNAGVLSYHQGSYDASVQRFREATELDPTLAEAFNNLGLSYTEMGREEEAVVAFERAIHLEPGSGQVYNNLGYLYYRKGDLDHAVEMYERAIQRGADAGAAYCNLGNAYYRLKRVDQAVQAWRRAVEADPANAKATAALERLGLAARVN